MQLGDPEIRGCPHCGHRHRKPTFLSGNSFGAVLWTDGFVDAGMAPEIPPVAECAACHRPFRWVDTSDHGVESLYVDSPHPYAGRPTEQSYLDVLREAKPTPAEELDLRRLCWWASTDRWDEAADNESVSPEQAENIERLRALLDTDRPDDRLTDAEALRRLGRFDDCVATLAEPMDGPHEAIADVIRSLAAQGIQGARALPEMPGEPVDDVVEVDEGFGDLRDLLSSDPEPPPE